MDSQTGVEEGRGGQRGIGWTSSWGVVVEDRKVSTRRTKNNCERQVSFAGRGRELLVPLANAWHGTEYGVRTWKGSDQDRGRGVGPIVVFCAVLRFLRYNKVLAETGVRLQSTEYV